LGITRSGAGIRSLWPTARAPSSEVSVLNHDARGVDATEEVSTPTIEALHRRFAGVIYDKCLRMLSDPAAAEDAVQETFIKAHQALSRLSDEAGALTWLYRIATNACLNILRTRRRKWAILCDWADDRPAEARNAEQVLIGRKLLDALIDQLDERSLAIIVAYYIDDMTQGEIATQLGISRRAVVKRLSAVREQAKSLWRDESRGGA
jgi:RNA polymerase sigma-70 factor (ECF subfamily)